MKKVFINFCLFLAFGTATVAAQTTCPEGGVLINGVCWATRNVDAPGTFAENPEDPGMMYQWNRKTAWPATGTVTGWDSSTPAGVTWEKVNDPSPAGWRVPMLNEINTLLDLEKVTNIWTTENGVNGRKFTDKATGNTLFLPAVGNRSSTANFYGERGFYWSSALHESGETSAYLLQFHSGNAQSSYASRGVGISVRSVAGDAPLIIVTGISLNISTLTLAIGGSGTIKANIMPVDATDKIITWTSSDPTKATVDANGKVTAIAAGTVTITAKAGDKTATCVVTVNNDSTTYDTGVVINGVKWATRNVDVPGTFANTPEDWGMYYQWNRKTAWSIPTGPFTGWDRSMPEGTEWEKVNDPSPAGWRVPSLYDIEKLCDTDKVDVTQTSGGHTFTDKATGNTLFLPGASRLAFGNGIFVNWGNSGFYWSSTLHESDEGYAYSLWFTNSQASSEMSPSGFGFSVRSVADNNNNGSTDVIPVEVTISPAGAVILTGGVPAGLTGVTGKGFEYRMEGTSTWTVVPVTGSFEFNASELPVGTYETRTFVETSTDGTLYSITHRLMVVCSGC